MSHPVFDVHLAGGQFLHIADVGPLPPNLAVTSIRPVGDRLAATVRNIGPRAREARVRLVLDGRAAGEMPVSIGAGRITMTTFWPVCTPTPVARTEVLRVR